MPFDAGRGHTVLVKIARVVMASVLVLCACAAQAAEGTGPAFAVEAGVATHDNYSLSAGLAWPLRWQRMAAGGEWTGRVELFVSYWSSYVQGGRESRTLVGTLPVVRYRPAGGRSDWFAEAGIGVSYMDALFRTDLHQFSTQFNFVSAIGVGRSFGTHHEHDLSLRASHYSNAGIKNPNPGENFMQLRYSRAL